MCSIGSIVKILSLSLPTITKRICYGNGWMLGIRFLFFVGSEGRYKFSSIVKKKDTG